MARTLKVNVEAFNPSKELSLEELISLQTRIHSISVLVEVLVSLDSNLKRITFEVEEIAKDTRPKIVPLN